MDINSQPDNMVTHTTSRMTSMVIYTTLFTELSTTYTKSLTLPNTHQLANVDTVHFSHHKHGHTTWALINDMATSSPVINRGDGHNYLHNSGVS